ncbi:Ferric siderophore transport system periplasmic binding protein TonB [Paramagnetospirillum magnetotacticum MS-1]|uniref:Ferric siderophore transport system periplasmic binding protein TonB n=1 Tax=Paramagnetospirillum magnetotacticum MS-1 TaxID=272627 RepID=A0A0C2UCS2_PARME|nr:energy transducer TonB [Paramagnetospirillum magnetotacticum]KIL99312.1 Ferric siderophore transport system periplasmic binding protein TonB [Paramagnetospirillum magnetotacticum MS-1]
MHAARQRPSSNRRLAGLAGVVALHAAAIYALANGLGHCAVEFLTAPMETKIVAELVKPTPPKVEQPPPPPKVVKPPPPAYVPPPRLRPQAPPPPAAITATTDVAPLAPPPPAALVAPSPEPVRETVKVAPALDQSRPCQPPQYPQSARRAGESGAVVLKFLIESDGAVLESLVDASSGFERLDEAARAALALCRFKPGTIDGRPERSWARIRYVWKLQ